ncbi:MAG TPA: sigma-54 dependent transcriptional regulator [Gemmatimonadales bacterium]|nr:sigma-54 dependent transcriptional regulator [Gemmatimonadales bacterium]
MSDHVLVVEDDGELREFLVEVLNTAGHITTGHPTAESALRAIGEGAPADVVVTDLIMPGMPGAELLRALRRQRPELNVIVMTAFGSIDSAVELVRAGAYDYLTKPIATQELLLAVSHALDQSRLRREVARLGRSAMAAGLSGFIGGSQPIQDLLALVLRAAQSRHPVLITGESGTGKELVARAIHQASGRGAFVAVNCGALPEQLLESELFGHEKGAFSGADRAKPGLFEAADGGVLLLDEIADLPLTLQPKLLRALENGEVRRVGATESRNLDVRVIAATNRDLDAEVQASRFREDLFYRLNVLHISTPPLRERAADIPLLAEHFLQRDTAEGDAQEAASLQKPRRISPEAMALLTTYPWPGNVRELRNAIQRASVVAAGEEVRPEDLPSRIREASRAAPLVGDAADRALPLRDVERLYILEVLRQAGGNKSRAAELLGLDRKTLYRKLEEYRLDMETPAPA